MEKLIQIAREARDEFGFDVFNCRELAERVRDNETDFEIGTVRFIHTDSIDSIMRDELESDLYVLGCFNASFLSGILGIDQDVIEIIQKSGAYEAVGKMIVSMDKLSDVQSGYVSADGYGHHFNGWDGSEFEIGDYIAFDNH